jgi:hypothetical protein
MAARTNTTMMDNGMNGAAFIAANIAAKILGHDLAFPG